MSSSVLVRTIRIRRPAVSVVVSSRRAPGNPPGVRRNGRPPRQLCHYGKYWAARCHDVPRANHPCLPEPCDVHGNRHGHRRARAAMPFDSSAGADAHVAQCNVRPLGRNDREAGDAVLRVREVEEFVEYSARLRTDDLCKRQLRQRSEALPAGFAWTTDAEFDAITGPGPAPTTPRCAAGPLRTGRAPTVYPPLHTRRGVSPPT